MKIVQRTATLGLLFLLGIGAIGCTLAGVQTKDNISRVKLFNLQNPDRGQYFFAFWDGELNSQSVGLLQLWTYQPDNKK